MPFGWVRIKDVEEQLKVQDARIRNISSQVAKLRQKIGNTPSNAEEEEQEEEEEEEAPKKQRKKQLVDMSQFQPVG